MVIGNVAINSEGGSRGEGCTIVFCTYLLPVNYYDASVSLSGDDVSAVSVDSMVLVMAGLMLALLIVLLVVALFLHRRHQVQPVLLSSVQSYT